MLYLCLYKTSEQTKNYDYEGVKGVFLEKKMACLRILSGKGHLMSLREEHKG